MRETASAAHTRSTRRPPHAKNVNVVFDGSQVTLEFWGGSESQQKSVLDGSVAQAKALGIVLDWKS